MICGKLLGGMSLECQASMMPVLGSTGEGF